MNMRPKKSRKDAKIEHWRELALTFWYYIFVGRAATRWGAVVPRTQRAQVLDRRKRSSGSYSATKLVARFEPVTGEDQSSVTSCCNAAEFGCRHIAPCLSWEPAAPIDNARPWAIARCFDQCTVDHLRSTHTRALANAPRARGRHAKRTG